MNKTQLFHSIADLSQDIAGSVPLELIREWRDSDRSEAAHERILEPHKCAGTIVCSDAAGLSRLGAGRPLIEVMKLISEPKERSPIWKSKLPEYPGAELGATLNQARFPSCGSPVLSFTAKRLPS